FMFRAILLLAGFSGILSWQPEGVDPYAVLGLNRGDSLEPAALKKAYRQAALKWHPDK
ncbi:unnamed protein product, partial [Polarella glacialis]